MELFIRTQDGQPSGHPIFADNFYQAFPDVDVNNLPPEFARFERIEPPLLGAYEVYEGVTYERRGDVFTDVHQVRQMTEAEKIEKQVAVKAQWASKGFSSWIFNEATCLFDPPVPFPQDGKLYRWDEQTISWIEISNT